MGILLMIGQGNTFNNHLTISIIRKAQKELLSPQEFYGLCQEIIRNYGKKKLYFLISNPVSLQGKKGNLHQQDILILLDYLSLKIKAKKSDIFKLKYYIRKINLKLRTRIITTIQVKNNPFSVKKK